MSGKVPEEVYRAFLHGLSIDFFHVVVVSSLSKQKINLPV